MRRGFDAVCAFKTAGRRDGGFHISHRPCTWLLVLHLCVMFLDLLPANAGVMSIQDGLWVVRAQRVSTRHVRVQHTPLPRVGQGNPRAVRDTLAFRNEKKGVDGEKGVKEQLVEAVYGHQ